MLLEISTEYNAVFQGLKIEAWKSMVPIGVYLASAGFAFRAIIILARAATTGSSDESVKGFVNLGYAAAGYAGVTALMNAFS